MDSREKAVEKGPAGMRNVVISKLSWKNSICHSRQGKTCHSKDPFLSPLVDQ